MSAPISIPHPVPCLYLPARGRVGRFGFASGSTSVDLRPFAEPPVELPRRNGPPILAAEGRAWVRAHDADTGGALGEAALRAILTDAAEPRPGKTADLAGYLLRSPLCSLSAGMASRTGDLDPATVGRVLRDGTELAAAEVRGFVADRIRLHEGAAYLRYERVLLASPLHVGFATEFPVHPRRTEGTSAHRRPGTFAGMQHGQGDWQSHLGLPPALLGDDDAIWFANVLPGRLIAALGRRQLVENQPEATRLDVAGHLKALAALERDGRTLYLTGDRLVPALSAIRDAALALSRLSADAANRTRMLSYAADGRDFAHAARTISQVVVPRLMAGLAPPSQDVESLSSLVP